MSLKTSRVSEDLSCLRTQFTGAVAGNAFVYKLCCHCIALRMQINVLIIANVNTASAIHFRRELLHLYFRISSQA